MREQAYNAITVTYEELAEIAGAVIEMQQQKIEILTRELDAYKGEPDATVTFDTAPICGPVHTADLPRDGSRGSSAARRNSFAYDGDF